jgi:sulfur-oxidizing protein SoxY
MTPVRAMSMRRRALLAAGGALVVLRVTRVRAAADELPQLADLADYLAGRVPRFGRLALDIPRLADNGNAVPLRISMTGLFASGAELRSIRLYSEKNPVPLMARFDFPVPPARADVDARVRLAGTQRIAAVAELANGELHAAVADVDVTISACLDGS